MSYWNNPMVTCPAFGSDEIWQRMQHRGQHCMLYSQHLPLDQIQRVLTLDHTCQRVNQLRDQGRLFDCQDMSNEVANLVRINIFYHSLQHRGNVKPMLLHYLGQRPFVAATGGTRMAALELLPSVTGIQCFVSAHVKYLSELADLEPVLTWQRFCELAGASDGDHVILRLTDDDAQYGLDWYEVSLLDPDVTVPQDPQCLRALARYLETQCPDFRFEPGWFRSEITWQFD